MQLRHRSIYDTTIIIYNIPRTNNNTIAGSGQSAADLQTNTRISTRNDASEAGHISGVLHSLIHL